MPWNIALATVLSLALGAWMLFDGARALRTGEYAMPRRGPYWSGPRSSAKAQ